MTQPIWYVPRMSENIFPVTNTVLVKAARVAAYCQGVAQDQDSIMHLAKEIAIPARQNIVVSFMPFRPIAYDDSTQYEYDEGCFYRYRDGKPLYARTREDVADAPSSDWPVRMAPRTGSKRARRRLIMDRMLGSMGVTGALITGMDHVEQLLVKHGGAGRYRRLDLPGAPELPRSRPLELLNQFDGLKSMQVLLDGIEQRIVP